MTPRTLDGQLSLNFDTTPRNTPGNCPHETKTVDIGGGKSFCALMDAWTNCREVKHCVHFADYRKG